MADFLKIAKSIVVHFAHMCAYCVLTVNMLTTCVLVSLLATFVLVSLLTACVLISMLLHVSSSVFMLICVLVCLLTHESCSICLLHMSWSV